VLVVEHDLDVIGSADYVIDLGPGAGTRGGQLLAVGPPRQLSNPESKTVAALRDYFAPEEPSVVSRQLSVNPKRSTKPKIRAPEARSLSVVRAREHNLKDVSVEIPHGKLTVVTGPSGSGKSSLAFDVVFAEGQRRFLETLTPYARQFLPTMPRPDVDRVTGVPPSIALEQRTTRAGAKSTVATVTEVAHYLRLMFAKLAVLHCPDHDEPISHTTPDAVFGNLKRSGAGQALLAPVVQARKGTYLDVFTAAERAGIEQAYCDGVLLKTSDPPRLAKTKEHTIDLVVIAKIDAKRLERADFERALKLGGGAVKLATERLPPVRFFGARARSSLVFVRDQTGPLRALRRRGRAGDGADQEARTQGRRSGGARGNLPGLPRLSPVAHPARRALRR